MSLRGAANVRTICEVLREINDLVQDDSAIHARARELLAEAESMGKRMSRKLVEYNKKVFAGWWKKNPDYAQDVEKRLNERYIVG
jgi:hypothetical protein